MPEMLFVFQRLLGQIRPILLFRLYLIWRSCLVIEHSYDITDVEHSYDITDESSLAAEGI